MGGAGVAREIAARLRAGGVGAFEEVDAGHGGGAGDAQRGLGSAAEDS